MATESTFAKQTSNCDSLMNVVSQVSNSNNSLPTINMSRVDNTTILLSYPKDISPTASLMSSATLKVSTGMSGWRYEIDDDGDVFAIPRYP